MSAWPTWLVAYWCVTAPLLAIWFVTAMAQAFYDLATLKEEKEDG